MTALDDLMTSQIQGFSPRTSFFKNRLSQSVMVNKYRKNPEIKDERILFQQKPQSYVFDKAHKGLIIEENPKKMAKSKIEKFLLDEVGPETVALAP